ncbi:MAG: peptidoglycan-associated lipoprotein Pal [Proteobacteria bacterium]|nr:peptidoglycan-associated lipoprotein Pal [Pseudomonadota bacterium]
MVTPGVTPESRAGGPAVAALTPETATLSREPSAAGRAVAAIPKGSQEDFVLNVGDTIYFDYDKSILTPESQRTLEQQAVWLKQFPGAAVTIQGHADERGTREYNLALGDRRATAVKNFLTALGVDDTSIEILSYGKERPAALGHNEAAWAQNRRGVTIIN